MPMPKLSPDDDDFIMKMKKVHYNNSEIARRVGVSEGTIRYRIWKKETGKQDGRNQKPSAFDAYRDVINQWKNDYAGQRRRPTLKTLHEWLCDQYTCEKSYDAFRRYIGNHFPEFKRKNARIRVETPPGALLFVDWKEDIKVQMGEVGRFVKLQALCFTLGFSRKMVVCFTERKDLRSFIYAHQEAFLSLEGTPQVIRTDCLKSAIVQWRGGRSVLNETYRRHLERIGVDCFPARPGTPEDKGKVEKKIKDLFSRMDFRHSVYKNMADLQGKIEKKLCCLEKTWRCGATGLSVEESFAFEKKHLRPLVESFPALPLRERRTRVRNDSTVFFEWNYYQVSRFYRDKSVLCVNTGQEILIYHEGTQIGRFPHLPGTKGMVMLSEDVIADPELHLSDTVRNWGLEVARRQVMIYQEIIRGRTA